MRHATIIALAVIAALALPACRTTRPPADLVNAMKVVETQVDIYVEEANWALEKAQHPDKDVLIGTGLRIRNAVKALSWWAQEAAGGSPGAPGAAATGAATQETPRVQPTP
jgi:hypothetical protein